MEIVRINKAISSLEAKITAGVVNNITAIQQTATVKTTAVGQTESSVNISRPGTSVNEMNASDMSTCSDSTDVPNQ